MLGKSCNVRWNIVVLRFPIYQLCKQTLLFFRKVREVALSVRNFLHSLLTEYFIYSLKQSIIGLSCLLNNLINFCRINVVFVLLIKIFYNILGKCGIGIMTKFSEHLNIHILIFGDIHICIRLLNTV